MPKVPFYLWIFWSISLMVFLKSKFTWLKQLTIYIQMSYKSILKCVVFYSFNINMVLSERINCQTIFASFGIWANIFLYFYLLFVPIFTKFIQFIVSRNCNRINIKIFRSNSRKNIPKRFLFMIIVHFIWHYCIFHHFVTKWSIASFLHSW